MRNNRGYILVEALVAITIIVVGLLGIFALLSRSLSLNRVVADRYTAAYLAVEGVEIIKNIIDNNLVNGRAWNTGLANGQFEVDYDDLALQAFANRPFQFNDGRYGYITGQPTRFIRRIDVGFLGGGEEIKVNSVVSWVGRGDASFEINLEDRFFNWR